MICDCEFDEYPKGDKDFGQESYHYYRKCEHCHENWWGLHCVHDGYQNPCPYCGRRPEVVAE